MTENYFEWCRERFAETDRLVGESDAVIARTEEIIGCPIDQFVPARWGNLS